MNISKIEINNIRSAKYAHKNHIDNEKSYNSSSPIQYNKVPVEYQYYANINFKSNQQEEVNKQLLDIPFIDIKTYKSMSNEKKERLRILYKNFPEIIDESQKEIMLKIDPHKEYLQIPLQKEEEMDEFIKVAQMYSKYKEHPIICLGRSPKWFLDASMLMQNGIPDYKFVAFSGSWFRIYDGEFGMNAGSVRLEKMVPTKTQEEAYKKYLENIQADPASIVETAKRAGKKGVITDYIDSGKGVTSFLDLMSRYAQEQGVLDEFAHSFDIVTIGNKEYRRNRRKVKYISKPEVWMPELLEPYSIPTTAWGTGRVIEQFYFDIDHNVFKQMLLNQNTTECRSTYYPCTAWTVFQPEKLNIGIDSDMNEIKRLVNHLHSEKKVYYFELVMSAFRNLLYFRILDGLNERGLLKAIHHTKL